MKVKVLKPFLYAGAMVPVESEISLHPDTADILIGQGNVQAINTIPPRVQTPIRPVRRLTSSMGF